MESWKSQDFSMAKTNAMWVTMEWICQWVINGHVKDCVSKLLHSDDSESKV